LGGCESHVSQNESATKNRLLFCFEMSKRFRRYGSALKVEDLRSCFSSSDTPDGGVPDAEGFPKCDVLVDGGVEYWYARACQCVVANEASFSSVSGSMGARGCGSWWM